MNNEIISYLEQANLSLKELVLQNKDSSKSTLDKVQLIKIKTGIDLIEQADLIAKSCLKIDEIKSENGYFSKMLFEIANFISNHVAIEELTSKEQYEEAMQLHKKTTSRNSTIYTILFDKPVDFDGLSAIESRQLENEINSKIIEQLAILINEASSLTYEAMVANAKKQMA